MRWYASGNLNCEEIAAQRHIRRQQIKTAAECQVELEGHIAVLERLTRNAETSTDLQQVVQRVREDMTGISEFLEDQFGTYVMSERATANSAAKAQQVFDTPELLELILLNLECPDLLEVQQVNRTSTYSSLGPKTTVGLISPTTPVQVNIDSSDKLQSLLGLRGDPKSSYKPTFQLWDRDKTSLYCETNYKRSPSNPFVYYTPPALEDDEIEITAYFVSHDHLPRLGKRCRSMLICQPPVMEMRPSLNCCSARDPRFFGAPGEEDTASTPRPIRSHTGITVGCILDATKRVREEHKLCPYAFASQHNADGFVQCFPRFRAVIRLSECDPSREITRTIRAENDVSDKKKTRLHAYGQAKLNGDCKIPFHCSFRLTCFVAYGNGQSVPTFAEFESANEENPS